MGLAASTLVVGAVLGATWVDQPSVTVLSGVATDAATSPPTPLRPPEAESRVIGDVSGVEVTVTPSTGLGDGDLVRVDIEELGNLPGAVLGQCTGDVTAESAVQACDFGAVVNPTSGESYQVKARGEQSVSVSRTIRIALGSSEDNTARPFDCATEPAGCVLVVAPFELPVRAVLVPLTFTPDGSPPGPATISVNPALDLRDGQEVAVEAEGLPPNSPFVITMCQTTGGIRCDGLERGPTAWSDSRGVLSATLTVRAALYDVDGRVDCTIGRCEVVVGSNRGPDRSPRAAISFAPDVVAPTPRLELEPAGPYVDAEVVTVRGTGFPPEIDVGARIAQCPADKDTAVENLCGYSHVEPLVVDPDGRFTMSMKLYDGLTPTGTCRGEPGCVLGWVLPMGTTIAKVRLDFGP